MDCKVDDFGGHLRVYQTKNHRNATLVVVVVVVVVV